MKLKDISNYVCKICGWDKAYSSKGILNHIQFLHKILYKEYYDKYLKKEGEGICPTCGRETKFGGHLRGYLKYCCKQCVRHLDQIHFIKNEKIGNFISLEEIRKNGNKLYYRCICEKCKKISDIAPMIFKSGKKEFCTFCRSTCDVGDIFGFLTIVKKEILSHGGSIITTQCTCGKFRIAPANRLLRGTLTSCGKCKIEERDCLVTKVFWKRVEFNCKHNEFELSLTRKDAEEIFLKQNKCCALTGVKMTIPTSNKRQEGDMASLDRINSDIGYTKDNCWWVLREVNRMKNMYPLDQFIDLCTLIADKNRKDKSELLLKVG